MNTYNPSKEEKYESPEIAVVDLEDVIVTSRDIEIGDSGDFEAPIVRP